MNPSAHSCPEDTKATKSDPSSEDARHEEARQNLLGPQSSKVFQKSVYEILFEEPCSLTTLSPMDPHSDHSVVY